MVGAAVGHCTSEPAALCVCLDAQLNNAPPRWLHDLLPASPACPATLQARQPPPAGVRLRRRWARQPPPAGVVRLRRQWALFGSAAGGPGSAAGDATVAAGGPYSPLLSDETAAAASSSGTDAFFRSRARLRRRRRARRRRRRSCRRGRLPPLARTDDAGGRRPAPPPVDPATATGGCRPGSYRLGIAGVCFRTAPTPVGNVTTFLHVRTASTLVGKVTPRNPHTPGRKLGSVFSQPSLGPMAASQRLW
jgi:hypothetical protein